MTRHYDLAGKYAIVTGASMGIGNAIALALAKDGANLALCALPSEKQMLDDFAASLERDHRIKAWAFAVDLAEQDGPRALCEETRKCLPQVDVLVNCAGIDVHGHYHELPFGIQDKLLRINVRAYMALMHLVLPDMVARKQGRILNVVSMAAFQPTPFLAAYGASKAFLQSLCEAVNGELKGTGVIVSTINPNNVKTSLLAKLPQDIALMRTNPPVSPAVVAGKAVKTIKEGKNVCVLTVRDWITAFVVPRVLPRSAVNYIAYTLLKPAETRRKAYHG